MNCPRCGKPLAVATYEDVQVDRCPACKGCWLDEGEVSRIVDSREMRFSAEQIKRALASDARGVPAEERRSVELCPKCAQPMLAVNYDHSSGVIIDRCPNAHGLWLDGEELERIQIHREHWEEEEAAHHAEWAALARSAVDDRAEAGDERRKHKLRPSRYFINSLIRKLLGG